MTQNYLLDLNVLIALAEPEHTHHRKAQEWFSSSRDGRWGVCPLTEAGFVRVTTNPAYSAGPHSVSQAVAILQAMKKYPDYWYWKIDTSWADLTAPFAPRIFGHQQVTDAYLLGMAIKENGVLVTFDKAIQFMAGPEFCRHVLVLE